MMLCETLVVVHWLLNATWVERTRWVQLKSTAFFMDIIPGIVRPRASTSLSLHMLLRPAIFNLDSRVGQNLVYEVGSTHFVIQIKAHVSTQLIRV